MFVVPYFLRCRTNRCGKCFFFLHISSPYYAETETFYGTYKYCPVVEIWAFKVWPFFAVLAKFSTLTFLCHFSLTVEIWSDVGCCLLWILRPKMAFFCQNFRYFKIYCQKAYFLARKVKN